MPTEYLAGIQRRASDLAPDAVPVDFPAAALAEPLQVIISAADGMKIHCQLFLPSDSRPGERHPAAIFFLLSLNQKVDFGTLGGFGWFFLVHMPCLRLVILGILRAALRLD